MVFEGDFVAGVIRRRRRRSRGPASTRSPFPSITPGANAGAVEIGGDLFVTFRDTPAIEAFVKFLATAPAAEAWAKLGRLRDRQPQHAGERLSRMRSRARPSCRSADGEAGRLRHVRRAAARRSAPRPARANGASSSTFLRNPSNVSGIQKKLESAATAAYKKGK